MAAEIDDTGPRMPTLCGGLSYAEAHDIVILLASMGIPARVEAGEPRGVEVHVPEQDLAAARAVVAEELTPVVADDARRVVDERIVAPKAWFGRGAVAVLVTMAMCVAVFVASLQGSDAGTRSSLLALGAIDYARVSNGEYWRLATGVFLHFDANHLFSNLAVLAIVGPPLAHQVGAWRFLWVFLVCGVGGNVASQLLMPTVALKGGASGAITGVLGALGGLSLRPERRARRKAWQTLGALAAIYGFLVGFDVTSDNVAHLGGLVAGLLLGRAVSPLQGSRFDATGDRVGGT